MEKSAAIDLTRRLIEHIEKNSSDLADRMQVEPSADFLDPQRFAREKQQFFLDSPQVVGFAGEVRQPDSYITREAMGIPLLITRDSGGQLHAFINACAHRGARVASGCGQQARLTCKFHGWTYTTDGHLHGRPQDSAFDRPAKSCRLRKLPVSDRSGLIVVGINPDMEQSRVDEHLAEIEDHFRGFEFNQMNTLETRRFEVNANWKLIAALSYESYHFATLHRDSVAQFLRANYVFDIFGKHSRWSFPMKGIEKFGQRPEAEWPAVVLGAVSHALFPGTVMITNPEDAQIIRTEPGNHPGHSIVYYTGVCRYPEKKQEAQAAYDFGGQAFEHEDLPAAIECQQGLSATGQDILIGKNEPIVQFWHQQWRKHLKD